MDTTWLAALVPGYHQWWLVAIYIALVGVFVIGVLRPRQRREWRSAGMAQAWVIALYAEMYGMPLTAWMLAHGTGQAAFLGDHQYGHAWAWLLGLGEWGSLACVIVGNALVIAGAVLALAGWRRIHRAHRQENAPGLVTDGIYAWIRHPQYVGFCLVMFGSLINWPTLITLLMVPALLVVYVRLARNEDADAEALHGDAWRIWAARTPGWIPRIPNTSPATA